MALDDKYDDIKKLIDAGKEKGYLTYNEVNDLIPHDVHSPEDLDDLLTTIGTQGIDVLEGPAKLPSSALEKKFDQEIEAGEDVELDLTPGALEKTNDPVRMYLREMGTVPLLTREGEVEIAKRIERGQLRVLKALSRSPIVIREIVGLGEDLKRGVRSIKEVVTFDEEEITEEILQNRLKEMTGRIDELNKHYKKSMQLSEKLAAIPAVKKKTKEYRRCRWGLGRELVELSRIIRKLGFTNAERKRLIERVNKMVDSMRALERQANNLEKKSELTRSEDQKKEREYVKLRKSGAQNYTGLCPFHNEKTGSFSVHATRQFYHCFGCGASGDVFSFVQKIEGGITFPEAVRLVAQKAGIPLPRLSFDSPQEAAEARLRGKLLEMQERACAFFQEQLRRPEGAHAREYLAGRGLTEEMIAGFRIGYAPDSGFLLKDRLKGEFDEEALKASGLFSWKESTVEGPRTTAEGESEPQPPSTVDRRPSALYSKFRNRVMFPIANESGRVIAFTGRTLSTDEKAGPKYLNSPETAIYSKSRVLFNLDKAREAIRKLDYAVLVEGQMDCISVYAAGFHNVIASSGTAFTEAQAKLLGRYSRKVVVNFDPDTAGASATERTLGLLVSEDFEIKVLSLEAGFDPDLYVRRRGAEAYATALRGSQKYFSYLIERARAQFPPRSPEAKVKAVNYLLPHVQRVPSRIVRDELANEIAQKLGIDSAVLRQELKQAATSRAARAVSAPAEAQVTPAERILIRALASGSRIQEGEGPRSTREGTDEEFDPARQARFFLQQEPLSEGLASEGLLQTLLEAGDADPLSLSLEDSERRLLAEILLQEADEELTPELLEGAVAALRRRAAARKLRQMQAELPAGGTGQDPLEQARLAQQRLKLKRTLSTGTGPSE